MCNTTEDWVDRLLAWFDFHRRELPWREQRTPYTTWLSEVMLQQTKVETVRPYYDAWLARFPTPQAVAVANESDILHAWQGLGYYNRVRCFQRAMKIIVSDYEGIIPSDKKVLLSLPGVGEYMVGAILSLAFGKPEPAVDGNMMRVFSRLYGLDKDVLTKEAKDAVMAIAKKVIPATHPGDFNEALMDLGATVCIPKYPKCGICPLTSNCIAYKTDQTEKLPIRRSKTRQPKLYVTVGIVSRDGYYLMHRRPGNGMLANMWEFPNVVTPKLSQGWSELQEHLGLIKAGALCWKHRHVFTHRIWEMRAYPASLIKENPMGRQWQWFRPNDWYNIPLAGPHVKLVAWLLERGE